jgi:hypothetical protein
MSQGCRPGPSVPISGMVPMPALVTGTGSDGNPLAQRPVFNSGTNVLTWQGPVGGGASNGDYTLQTRTLTSSGAITTSSNGQIIQGLNIQASNQCVIVQHSNVIIRQNRIQLTPFNNASDTYCINVVPGLGTTGIVIEDNELDANTDSNEGNCVGGLSGNLTPIVSNVTMRRNNCHHAGQAIRYVLNNISFTENYCHQIAGADADWFECYPNGGQCDNLTVQYNYFTDPDNSGAGADSGINLSPGAGLFSGRIGPNVVIDSNWFVWHSSTNNVAWQSHNMVNGIGGGVASGRPEQLEFTFTNNGIWAANPNGYGFNNSTLLGAPSSGNDLTLGGLIHDSGNFVMGSATHRTGVPYVGINGSGRL